MGGVSLFQNSESICSSSFILFLKVLLIIMAVVSK